VRRTSNKIWYILNSEDDEISRINFGLQEEDIPVPADYDGDGKTDLAFRRPSESSWYILQSSDMQILKVTFGLQPQDIPIIADYDGDGKADLAFRRASNQTQYILRSTDFEIGRIQFGLNENDMPLAAPVLRRFSNNLNVAAKDATSENSKLNAQSEFLGMAFLTMTEAVEMKVYRPQ
jgi:hypothetical protein